MKSEYAVEFIRVKFWRSLPPGLWTGWYFDRLYHDKRLQWAGSTKPRVTIEETGGVRKSMSVSLLLAVLIELAFAGLNRKS